MGRGPGKPIYRGNYQKQGAWIVCRFNGGLGEKEGCGVFEGGGWYPNTHYVVRISSNSSVVIITSAH